MSIHGNRFQGEVEVRWNAPDGPEMATATGPDFSKQVTIPNVPDGLYTILAVTRGNNGGLFDVARAEFEVSSVRGGAASRHPGEAGQSLVAGRATSANLALEVVAGLALAGSGLLLGLLIARSRPGRVGAP